MFVVQGVSPGAKDPSIAMKRLFSAPLRLCGENKLLFFEIQLFH
jgi:hypothetical protein